MFGGLPRVFNSHGSLGVGGHSGPSAIRGCPYIMQCSGAWVDRHLTLCVCVTRVGQILKITKTGYVMYGRLFGPLLRVLGPEYREVPIVSLSLHPSSCRGVGFSWLPSGAGCDHPTALEGVREGGRSESK